MAIEQRHDIKETIVQTTSDARARRMQEIREQLTGPITVGEFRRLEAPHRSDALRRHIFGNDEPFDFLTELRKRREAGETNE